MTTNLTDPQAPVTDEELDQLIWGLERYGLYPRQLAALKELREVRRAKPYGYVNQALYEEIGCCGLTNDHEAYADSSTHIPLYRIPQPAASIKPVMLNAEKLNQPVSETERRPSWYLQGHQDGLEWAAQMAEANHPQTGDWLYDDPIALAAAIRKGPDMPLASGNSPVTPDSWKEEAEKLAEAYGAAFVISRNGEEPVCADPTKFWFGFDPAAPKEVKAE